MSCKSNTKKLRLEVIEKQEIVSEINKDLDKSVTMDTLIRQGVKYTEHRSVDRENPAVTLNFPYDKMPVKNFDLANYYSQIQYIKIKYPYPEGCFLNEAVLNNTGEKLNSQVYLTSNNIIAGDYYMGFHCYDLSGNFMYTIAAMDKLPDYNRKKNKLVMDNNQLAKKVVNFSVYGNTCMITTEGNNKYLQYFYDLSANKTILRRPDYPVVSRANTISPAMLISPQSYVLYTYDTFIKPGSELMESFDVKGDSLCIFKNYNSFLQRQRKRLSFSETPSLYYYNGLLTLRQEYNDTVYRVKSPFELVPAYIIDFEKQKLSIDSAFYGDKTGKLMQKKLIETGKFLLVVNCENEDNYNNRQNGKVQFLYSVYDKGNNIHYKINNEIFPEDYWISNSVKDGIPVYMNTVKSDGKKMYAGYTKARLESLINNKNFSSFSKEQQDKIKLLYNELTNDEMIVMILE